MSELGKIALVLLESMWDPARAGQAVPSWFQISPSNHSGKRLYRIIGRRFLVGNVCPTMQAGAKHHGTPSVAHTLAILKERAERLAMKPGVRERQDLLVVGGSVAKMVVQEIQAIPSDERKDLLPRRILFIPHPAFRFWSAKLEAVALHGMKDDFLVYHQLNPRTANWETVTDSRLQVARVGKGEPGPLMPGGQP